MADPAQVPEIWNAAVKRFEELTKKGLEDASVKDLQTVDDLLKHIENRHKEFTEFRQKQHALYAALSAAMGPVQLVGSIAREAIGNVYPASFYVFGAVSTLFDAAKGVSANYESIIMLMETLKDFTVRLETYDRHSMSPGLKGRIAEILATVLEILAVSQKEVKQGRLIAFGKSLIKKPGEAKELLTKLERLFDSEKGLVGAETLSGVKDVSATVDKISADLLNLSTTVSSLNLNPPQTVDPVKRIKDILKPSGSSVDRYLALKRNRVPLTATWFRSEPAFQEWASTETAEPILWISGTPGSGKSHLASGIITDLIAQYPTGSGSCTYISHFFFKDDNQDTRSFSQALREAAFLISQEDPAYAEHILAACDSTEDISTLPKAWNKLIVSYFIEKSNDSKAIIVLDGMDESFQDERQAFFELAKDLEMSGRVRMIMLGRPQIVDEIELYLERSLPTIYVTAHANSGDISRYIQNSISKSVYLRRASSSLRHDLVTQLSRKAKGMFLWVDLMLKDILKMRNEGSIRKALREAPRGLNDMLRHVLEAFATSLQDAADVAEDLNEVLAWVTCAVQPMSLEELDNVLKWKSDTGDGVMWLEGIMRKQFASFFTLIREDGLTTADLQRAAVISFGDVEEELRTSSTEEFEGGASPDAPADFDSDPLTTEVTFNHASISDFFRNEKEGPVSSGDGTVSVGININEARVLVVRRCLEIITCDSSSSKATLASKLRSYAASAWLKPLEDLDTSKIAQADRESIANLLGAVFAKESGLGAQASDFKRLWGVFSESGSELLKKWLRLASDSEVTTWLDGINAENRDDIFRKAVLRSGRRWLTSSDPDGGLAAVLIAAHLRRQGGNSAAGAEFRITEEEVLQSAEWVGVEKNSLWHRSVGRALQAHGYHAAATSHLVQAFDLSSPVERWPVRHDISWSWLDRDELEKTIQLDTQMAAELEPLLEESHEPEASQIWRPNLHQVHHRLAYCYRMQAEKAGDEKGTHPTVEQVAAYDRIYRELGDKEADALGKAITYYPRCYACFKGLVAYLHWPDRHEDVIAIIRRLTAKGPEDEHCDLVGAMVECHWNYDEEDLKGASVIAQRDGHLEVLLDALKDAVVVARTQRKATIVARLELNIAAIYDELTTDREQANRIFAGVLAMYENAPVHPDMVQALAQARISRSDHLLRKALESGLDTRAGRAYGELLEKLVAVSLRHDQHGDIPSFKDRQRNMELWAKTVWNRSFLDMGNIIPPLHLAHYYRLLDRPEDARVQTQVVMRAALNVLADDEPSNDMVAHLVIAGILAVWERTRHKAEAEASEWPEETVAVLYMMWAERTALVPLFADYRAKAQRDFMAPVTSEAKPAEYGSDPRVSSSSHGERSTNEGGARDPEGSAGIPPAPWDITSIGKTVSWSFARDVCDSCWGSMRDWTVQYFCYYCFASSLCQDCHTKLVANDGAEVALCSPLHDWVEIRRPAEELTQNWRIGYIFLRGEWVKVEDWKESLRERFLRD